MNNESVIGLASLAIALFGFSWPIFCSRRGVLSIVRWLILSVGFGIIAWFCTEIASSSHQKAWVNPAYRTQEELFFNLAIFFGPSCLSSIFAAAFHRNPTKKTKAKASSFLLDDKNW